MITLKLISSKIKKPFRSKENILAIYSSRKYIIPEAETVTIDSEIIITLPSKSIAYQTTKFKGQKNKRATWPTEKEIKSNVVKRVLFSKTYP